MSTPAAAAVATAAFLICLLTSEIAAEIAQNSAEFHNLGRRRPQQQSLCAELIEPPGYSCSEHTVSTYTKPTPENFPFLNLIINFVKKQETLRYPNAQNSIFFFTRFRRKMDTFWEFNACHRESGS